MQVFEHDQCIYRLHASDPVGSVKIGETFVAKITNAFGKKFERVDQFELFMQSEAKNKSNHPCTGPILIEGVDDDSSVLITIRRLAVENAMSCLSKSTGFMRVVFEGRQPKIAERNEEGFVRTQGLLIREDPSIGLIATLDAEDRSPGRCSQNGGNMDIPYLQESSQIILPVNYTEALLAIGDLHFRQGFGEASGMGMEADGSVELQIDVCEKVPYPVIDNSEFLSILGWGLTQKEAQERAVSNAIDYIKKLVAFRFWSDADIYQLLGGFGLLPGNATGNVVTFAQTIRKRDIVDPVTRQTVVFLPEPQLSKRSNEEKQEYVNILDSAISEYDQLCTVHKGDSREIRSLPDKDNVLIAKLLPHIFSFQEKGAIESPGTDLVRAAINDHLVAVLHRSGIRTSTLATKGEFVLMSKEDVSNKLEIVFKSQFSGSTKHRYKNLPGVPTRTHKTLVVGEKHPPYVRFDWRNIPPEEDEVMPEGLASHYIDVEIAKITTLRAQQVLQKYMQPRDLDVVEGCFFLSEDGRVICGEVSCDNMNIVYRGHNTMYQEIFADRSKDAVLKKWQLILKLLNDEV